MQGDINGAQALRPLGEERDSAYDVSVLIRKIIDEPYQVPKTGRVVGRSFGYTDKIDGTKELTMQLMVGREHLKYSINKPIR